MSLLDSFLSVTLPILTLGILLFLSRYVIISILQYNGVSSYSSPDRGNHNSNNNKMIFIAALRSFLNHFNFVSPLFELFSTLSPFNLSSHKAPSVSITVDPTSRTKARIIIMLTWVFSTFYFVFFWLSSYRKLVWNAPTLDSLLLDPSPDRENNEIGSGATREKPAYEPCFYLGLFPFCVFVSMIIALAIAKILEHRRLFGLAPGTNNNHHHHHHHAHSHRDDKDEEKIHVLVDNNHKIHDDVAASGENKNRAMTSTTTTVLMLKMFVSGFLLSALLGLILTVVSLSHYNLLCGYNPVEFTTLCDEASGFMVDVEYALRGVEDELFEKHFSLNNSETRHSNPFDTNSQLETTYFEKWKKSVRSPRFDPSIPLPLRFVNVHKKEITKSSKDQPHQYEYSYSRTNQTKKLWLHNSNLLASMRHFNRDNNFFIKNDHDFDLCIERAFFPKLVQYLRSSRKYYFSYFENNNQKHYTRSIPQKIRIYSQELSRWYEGHSGTWMIDVDECYYALEPLREHEEGCNGHYMFTLPSVRDSVAHLEAEYPESDWKKPKSYNMYGACSLTYFIPVS